MRLGVLSVIATVLALVALLGSAGIGSADFGPIRLLSKNTTEQADSASEPAISADGHYVAFQAALGGLKGVFRENLETGAVLPVSAGSQYAAIPNDASAPAISADGSYVSFTTRESLLPALDDSAGPQRDSDVYVADMRISPPEYELASIRPESTEPIGGTAAPRVALSGNGRKVVFVSGSQVYLRDLEAGATTLVSAQREGGQMKPGVPVPGGAVMSGQAGASLSADGSTVAWPGVNLQNQVPMLSDEPSGPSYNEPLWRRIADGPTAPTRRIIGGGDPTAPGCPAGGSIEESACQGPFPTMPSRGGVCVESVGWLNIHPAVNGVPQLSADGRTVALIGEPDNFSDVYIVDMDDGLTRTAALSQLTSELQIEEPCNLNDHLADAGDILDLAISADGNRVAFTTVRQQFPSTPPFPVTSAPPSLGLTEVYLADLEGQTLELVTHGTDGGASLCFALRNCQPGSPGASSPSLAADGSALAFASLASNLVAGDANGNPEEGGFGSDVFAVSEERAPDRPGETQISGSPPPLEGKRRWRLVASAVSLSSGRVRVRAVVPGSGTLRGAASALVGDRLAEQRVAGGARRARREGLVRLDLELKRPYRRLAHDPGGLAATLRLNFRGPGGKPLSRRLDVKFRRGHSSTGRGGSER